MFDNSFIANCRTIDRLNYMMYEIHFYDNRIIFSFKCKNLRRKCILSDKKLKPCLRKCLHLDSNKF